MVYESMYLVSGVCAPIRNDLKLGIVLVLDSLAAYPDFGFKRSRVRIRAKVREGSWC